MGLRISTHRPSLPARVVLALVCDSVIDRMRWCAFSEDMEEYAQLYSQGRYEEAEAVFDRPTGVLR